MPDTTTLARPESTKSTSGDAAAKVIVTSDVLERILNRLGITDDDQRAAIASAVRSIAAAGHHANKYHPRCRLAQAVPIASDYTWSRGDRKPCTTLLAIQTVLATPVLMEDVVRRKPKFLATAGHRQLLMRFNLRLQAIWPPV